MLTTYLLIVSALVAAQVSAFPNGAPRSACGSLTPIHMLFSAKDEKAPFSLSVSSRQVKAGSTVTVTLQSSDDTEFKGYIIQARTDADSTAGVGTFSIPEGSEGKTLDCPGGTANAVTHSGRSKKTSESFVWTAPEDLKGKVTFQATVVVGFRTFYTEVQSSAIIVA